VWKMHTPYGRLAYPLAATSSTPGWAAQVAVAPPQPAPTVCGPLKSELWQHLILFVHSDFGKALALDTYNLSSSIFQFMILVLIVMKSLVDILIL
jgi:hypothetical protein